MSTAHDIARLLRSLGDPDAEVRSAALIALAEIQRGVPGAPILPLLADADEAVRAAAAFALSKVGDAGAVPELLAAWRATSASQHHLQRQLLIALGDIGGLPAIGPIVGAFWDLSPELQELVLGFVGAELGSAAPYEAIAREAAADPGSAAADGLAEALLQLQEHDPEARPLVVAALVGAASAALDAGAGSEGASAFVMALAYCARAGAPLLEAAPLGERLLATAAGEVKPSLPAIAAAQLLAGRTDLAARMVALDPDAEAEAAREHAPSASLPDLIEAVRAIRPAGAAQRCILHELVRRGPGAVDTVAQALLADPLPAHPGADETLCAALGELHERAPEVRGRVVAALIDVANAVLDAGGEARRAFEPLVWLCRCAVRGGPIPEATPPALRLLALAAAEEDPYLPALGAAERLAGMPVARLAELLASLDRGTRWRAAWKYAPSASIEEVIEAAERLPPNDPAQDHLSTSSTCAPLGAGAGARPSDG